MLFDILIIFKLVQWPSHPVDGIWAIDKFINLYLFIFMNNSYLLLDGLLRKSFLHETKLFHIFLRVNSANLEILHRSYSSIFLFLTFWLFNLNFHLTSFQILNLWHFVLDVFGGIKSCFHLPVTWVLRWFVDLFRGLGPTSANINLFDDILGYKLLDTFQKFFLHPLIWVI
jgi:hypothetical protein